MLQPLFWQCGRKHHREIPLGITVLLDLSSPDPWNREPEPFREGRAFSLSAVDVGVGRRFDVPVGSLVQLQGLQPAGGEGSPDTRDAA